MLSPISLLLSFSSLIFCLVLRIFSRKSITVQSNSVLPLLTADSLLYKSSLSPLSFVMTVLLLSISMSLISLLRSVAFACLDFFKGFGREKLLMFLNSSAYSSLRAFSSLPRYCCSCSIAGVDRRRYSVFLVIH